MTATDSNNSFTLGVERRYPLRLGSSLPDLAAIYRAACRDTWDPETVVDVEALRALSADDATSAAAAAAAWSFAAWVEYTSITESDALLIRFCIEDGREAEVKFLLTSRGQGRALAAETGTLVSRALAPRPAPSGRRWTAASLRGATRGLLQADVPPDALVCARLVLAEAVDVAMWEAALAYAAPDALRSVIERLLTDRRRMLEFGWAYAGVRLPQLSDAGRVAVEAALPAFVAEERLGARCAALHRPARPGGDDASAADTIPADAGVAGDLSRAAERAAAAGLGVAPAAAATRAIAGAVGATLARLAELGVSLPQGA